MKYGKRMYAKSKRTSKLSISKVKKIVNQSIAKKAELKSIDVSNASASPTVLVPLEYSNYFEVAQGDTALTRDGNQLTLRNITIRGHLTATDGDTVRIVWVFIPDDTMDAGLTADFTALTYNGFLPRYQDQRYRVLSDKTYNMVAVNGEVVHRDIKTNFKLNKKITYAGSASSIERGELSCHVYVRDNTTAQVTYNDNARVYFYDM